MSDRLEDLPSTADAPGADAPGRRNNLASQFLAASNEPEESEPPTEFLSQRKINSMTTKTGNETATEEELRKLPSVRSVSFQENVLMRKISKDDESLHRGPSTRLPRNPSPHKPSSKKHVISNLPPDKNMSGSAEWVKLQSGGIEDSQGSVDETTSNNRTHGGSERLSHAGSFLTRLLWGAPNEDRNPHDKEKGTLSKEPTHKQMDRNGGTLSSVSLRQEKQFQVSATPTNPKLVRADLPPQCSKPSEGSCSHGLEDMEVESVRSGFSAPFTVSASADLHESNDKKQTRAPDADPKKPWETVQEACPPPDHDASAEWWSTFFKPTKPNKATPDGKPGSRPQGRHPRSAAMLANDSQRDRPMSSTHITRETKKNSSETAKIKLGEGLSRETLETEP
eukprot:GHVN01089751.1.p1 GENE.GHVN01089751.1~~GHVN01089751.1.p1  ORF type:complete len:395 (+),score=44.30 GHVN01089751.1:926-2110(+)